MKQRIDHLMPSVLGATLLIAAASAPAATTNLTTAGSSGSVNGALFQTTSVRPTGTGVIDPFLRVQANGTEQGYNTSGRPVAFDEHTDPNYTRDLVLNELATTTISGIAYFEFLLDINEPNGGGQNLLTLDKLQFYTSPTGSQTTSNVASLGSLCYDLDAGTDNAVLMDYNLASGSGSGDVRIFIPISAFAAAAATDFVYLYCLFGEGSSSGDGFEEFAALTGAGPVIPLPTTAALATVGIASLGVRRRRVRL
jgi:hypothetical protein